MRSLLCILSAAVCLCASFPAMAQSSDGSGNADLEKRIQRLEEQIVDLNAQLGTIETMAQDGFSAAPSASPGAVPGGPVDEGRLTYLETQVQALSSQLNDVINRLDRIEGGGNQLGAQAGNNPADLGAGSDDQFGAQPAEQGTGFSVGGNQPSAGGFGTTIESGDAESGNAGDAGRDLGNFFDSGAQDSASQANFAQDPVRTAANSSPEAQSLYQQAYNALVQRNYRGAADGFQQFVDNFANDPLAGQAYHWRGEAAFINGEYRVAADSFLKSSTNYPQNEKAPESLLKLGIALKRLDENQAACSSFAELSRRFPNATPVLERAERERQRAGC